MSYGPHSSETLSMFRISGHQPKSQDKPNTQFILFDPTFHNVFSHVDALVSDLSLYQQIKSKYLAVKNGSGIADALVLLQHLLANNSNPLPNTKQSEWVPHLTVNNTNESNKKFETILINLWTAKKPTQEQDNKVIDTLMDQLSPLIQNDLFRSLVLLGNIFWLKTSQHITERDMIHLVEKTWDIIGNGFKDADEALKMKFLHMFHLTKRMYSCFLADTKIKNEHIKRIIQTFTKKRTFNLTQRNQTNVAKISQLYQDIQKSGHLPFVNAIIDSLVANVLS